MIRGCLRTKLVLAPTRYYLKYYTSHISMLHNRADLFEAQIYPPEAVFNVCAAVVTGSKRCSIYLPTAQDSQ